MNRLTIITALIIVASLATNTGVFYYVVTQKKTIQTLRQEFNAEQSKSSNLEHQTIELSENLTTTNKKLSENEKQLTDKLAELKTIQQEITAKKKENESLATKLKNQESQISSNAAELEKLRDRPPLFIVENNTQNFTAVDELKTVVTGAFDEIKSVYGQAYLLHQVTIQLIDSLSIANAAGEITIENSKEGLKLTIKIKKFSKGSALDVTTIVHEIIHAFHGIAFLEPVAFEEGITVAATEEIVAFLIAKGVVPDFSTRYLRISPEREAQLEADPSFVIPASTGAFYGSDQTGNYYQMTGRAWQQFAKDDRGFYKRFNEALYSKVKAGTTITKQVVLDTIAQVKSSVNGKSMNDYLSSKKAFNPA